MNKDIEYAEYEISTFEFVICKYEYKVAKYTEIPKWS